MTQPLVHYHFASKDALWRAAVDNVLGLVNQSIEVLRYELDGKPPAEQLELTLRAMVRFNSICPEFGRIVAYEGALGGERLQYLFEKRVDVFFDNSPVMELAPDAAMRGVKTVAWFDNKAPLRSGWAWGQHYLEGGTAGIEAQVGKGKVFLFGPEITFRAQPHGTFKFLFNSIFYGASVTMTPGTTTNTSAPQLAGVLGS